MSAQRRTLSDYINDCPHCSGSLFKPSKPAIVRTVIGNGDSQVWVTCEACGKNINGPGIFIPHALISDLENIPIAKNYSTDSPACEVSGCERPGELHHWACQSIFGQRAWDWPMSYLCRVHHVEWHQLVTPKIGAQADD